MRFCDALCLATFTLAACGAPDRDGATPDMKWHEDETLGLRFAYPDSFLIGSYAPEELPPAAVEAGMERPFVNAVVLIHPSMLGDYELDAIAVGEESVIWIDRPISTELVFRAFPADLTYTIGELEVARFPGYPSPYGDQAHYYIVKFADGEHYELAAHRYFWHTPEMTPTGYDRIIEKIIPTLERLGGGN